MQIHELNQFSGTPGSGDYLAIDNGTETMKVPGNSIFAAMTRSQAQSGSNTVPKVIAPSVFKAAVLAIARTISDTWVSITDMKCNLNTSAASGTVDGDLYTAITALGWQSDVIE